MNAKVSLSYSGVKARDSEQGRPRVEELFDFVTEDVVFEYVMLKSLLGIEWLHLEMSVNTGIHVCIAACLLHKNKTTEDLVQ